MGFDIGRVGGAASLSVRDLLARRFEQAMWEERVQRENERFQAEQEQRRIENERRRRIDAERTRQQAFDNTRVQRDDFLRTTLPGAELDPETTKFALEQGLGTLITNRKMDQTLPSTQFGPDATGGIAKTDAPSQEYVRSGAFTGTPEYLVDEKRRAIDLARDKEKQEKELTYREKRDAAEDAFKREELRIQDAQRRDVAAMRIEGAQAERDRKQAEKDRQESQKDDMANLGRAQAKERIDELIAMHEGVGNDGKPINRLNSIVGMVQGRLPVIGEDESNTLAAWNQVVGLLSLQGRQALKGSGSISDFESKMLQAAASALSRTGSVAAAVAELKKLSSQLDGPAPGTRAYREAQASKGTLRTSPPANPKKGDTFNGFKWDGTGWTK